jgi:hypothetical protein
MWSKQNAGQINVAYNPENDKVYNPKGSWLKGRFRWSDAPYTQVVNLKEIIVADTQDKWTKKVSPIRLFDDWATLKIGGYTNSYPNRRAGSIMKLRIIYKWWNITLVE